MQLIQRAVVSVRRNGARADGVTGSSPRCRRFTDGFSEHNYEYFIKGQEIRNKTIGDLVYSGWSKKWSSFFCCPSGGCLPGQAAGFFFCAAYAQFGVDKKV